MHPTRSEIRALRLQALVGRAAFPVVGPTVIAYLRFVRKNRIRDRAAVRRAYRELTRTERPLVVCANHLTMFDSLFLHWALASPARYLLDFRLFAWNVPAVENFKRGLLLRALTYLGKTVPIDRGGSPEHHREVLAKLAWLAAHGQICTIFPEGGRSRTGRVEPDRVTYGVGHILKELERPLVLCVYLRGERQTTWGYLPERGDELYVALELLEPTTTATGLRAARDLSRQVAERLKQMEERYFERHPGRS